MLPFFHFLFLYLAAFDVRRGDVLFRLAWKRIPAPFIFVTHGTRWNFGTSRSHKSYDHYQVILCISHFIIMGLLPLGEQSHAWHECCCAHHY
jgi:hypothetical protein